MLTRSAQSKTRPWAYVDVASLFVISMGIMTLQFVRPQLASCVIDDSILQMSWIRQFANGLSSDVWLPRWMPEANGGYGSPVFIFYSPLVYYVSAFFFWLTGSVIFSMKLVRFLALFLSAWAMLKYSSEDLPRSTAWMVAAVYLTLPFHVLDISYWTLYAEPCAWIWFPLLLLFQQRMMNSNKLSIDSVLLFSICYAGLILTHLVSAYLFSFILAGYFFWSYLPRLKFNQLRQMVLAVVLGLLGSSFFLLPAICEQRLVHLEYSTLLPEFDFRNTFLLFPSESLIKSNDFMGKTLRLLQGTTLLQGVWTAFGAILIFRTPFFNRRWRRKALFALVVCLVCLFLMSQLSQPIWLLVPLLPKIQFSTRWLSLYSLMSAIVVGMGFQAILHQNSRAKGWLQWSYIAICCLSLLTSALIVYSSCLLDVEHEDLALKSAYNAPEYNPRKMPNWKQRIIYPEDPPVMVCNGEATTEVLKWEAQQREINVDAKTPVQIRLRILDYAGWKIDVNHKSMTNFRDIQNGAILLHLPPGLHQVSARFENTWWRNLGNWLSITVVLLSGGCYWWAMNRSHLNRNNGGKGVP